MNVRKFIPKVILEIDRNDVQIVIGLLLLAYGLYHWIGLAKAATTIGGLLFGIGIIEIVLPHLLPRKAGR